MIYLKFFFENKEECEVESEAWASFARRWEASYSQNWNTYKIWTECLADFVDWSISVRFED